jgi:hypothetical protein
MRASGGFPYLVSCATLCGVLLPEGTAASLITKSLRSTAAIAIGLERKASKSMPEAKSFIMAVRRRAAMIRRNPMWTCWPIMIARGKLTLFDKAGLEVELAAMLMAPVDLCDREMLEESARHRAEREAVLVF